MAHVTVAMNIYNGMPYLPEAVESLRAQTLRDIEIILVNDGSTDESPAYLDSLSDARIRVFHQPNQGTAVASNLAIENCRTAYYARMDADDVALPDRLETQLEFLESHPEVGMVGTQAAWLGPTSVGKSIKLPTTHEAIWKALVDGHHAMVHATLMMRTEVIRGVGGYWSIPDLDDDTDMMLRMGEVSELANIDRTLYHYRILQGSLSGAGMKRVRFSYDYSIELSRRRRSGLPPLTPDEFAVLRNSRPWWSRLYEPVDIHARLQYRRATEEIFGQHPYRGRARLLWAALCSPSLTWQRLRRMLRRVPI